MAHRKPDLYRWERVSKPRVYSRSQKVTTGNDIQDWIRKVEDASSKAAAQAFGVPSRYSGHDRVRTEVEDVHLHDAAYTEAQDLLQQWVTEKLDFNSDDTGFEDDLWAVRSRKSAEVKQQWDNLVAENDIDYDLDLDDLGSSQCAAHQNDIRSTLDEDSDQVVDNILSSMLQKDVVGDRFLQDLGLEDKAKQIDPTVKMAVRHQQVKANREKREREKQKKLHEAQSRKEAQTQARQMVQKEEKVKDLKKKREEAAIQSQMALIRKEMADERRQREEERQREKDEQQKKQWEAEIEVERQCALEDEARLQIAQEDSERQRKIQKKLHEMETRNTTIRLKLQHKYFSAWYEEVADRRLWMGKARAMADWKLLLKTWKGWRSYVSSRHLDIETQRHLAVVKERQRKHVQAVSHHRATLLRRCLAAWLLFAGLERQQKEVVKEQNATRSKMAAFLQAATAGSLWAQPQGGDPPRSPSQDKAESSSARQQVADMFAQPAPRQKRPESSRSSSVTTDRSHSAKRQPPPKPSQAWQLTRKDAQLTPEEVERYTQGKNGSEVSSAENTDRSDNSRSGSTASSRKPWEKKAYIVNSTEHRTVAQQKILEQQQHQIKEQQRLIVELTYLQKQQMLQTQMTQQQMLQQQLAVKQVNLENSEAGGMSKRSSTAPPEKPAMGRQPSSRPTTLIRQPSSDGSDSQQGAPPESNRAQTTLPLETARSENSKASTKSTPTRRSDSSTSHHTNFLKTMEERAKERERLKQEREEKKRRAEEEKLVQLKAEEEERLQQDEEEKKRKMEAYREKKRMEKQRELEKQQQQELMRQQLVTADLHYQKALVRFRGWYPWRCLMNIAGNRKRVAEEHYKTNLMRRSLLEWSRIVQEDLEHKRGLADEMFKFIIVRRCFHNWRRVGECVAIQESKAGRFHNVRLRARVFEAWRDRTEQEKMAMLRKTRQAREHNLRRLKKFAFNAFRKYPQQRKEAEERERRKGEMRKKVATMLTDYEVPSVKTSVESNISEFFTK